MPRCPEPIPAPQSRRRYLVLALLFLGAALVVGLVMLMGGM